MTEPLNIVPFPDSGNEEWIGSYHQACLIKRNEATIDAYLRILRQFTQWVAKRPGHAWFRVLKQHANKEEWELIASLSFHDLRHDFAHRAREAGWTLEEVAYYLGHVTMKGTPAIQTTVRYTQVSRAQVKEKLRLMKG